MVSVCQQIAHTPGQEVVEITRKVTKTEAELAALPNELEGATSSTNDPLEPFNSRVPRSLQRRLKVHVALHDSKIQDVLGAALDEYLTRHGS